MKFSAVVAALEDGKKVKQQDETYYRLANAGEGTRRRLVRVWPDGSWNPIEKLPYHGPDEEDWSVIP